MLKLATSALCALISKQSSHTYHAFHTSQDGCLAEAFKMRNLLAVSDA